MGNQIEYVIDTACQNFIEGWAVSAHGPCTVDVMVDGRVAGQAIMGLVRDDVGAAFPAIVGSGLSGFIYAFSPVDLAKATGDIAVSLRIRTPNSVIETERVEIPAIREAPAVAPPARSCFPRLVAEAIVGRAPRLAEHDLADEHAAVEAVDVLAYLATRGARPLPGVHRYLAFVRSIVDSALFIAKNFPRANPRPTGEKDPVSVLTNPIEIASIAHHLYVLDDLGVPGCVVEFGCFKGYSTSILSRACQLLGRVLHVFDSFRGLPASASVFYRAGEFAGDFDEVCDNVREFGRLDSVEFHRGFFDESVGRWPAQPVMCLWMDVDLERSAVDALHLFGNLDRRAALFSHECSAEAFDVHHRPVLVRGPDSVVGPIVDAFASHGRSALGRFLLGNTGAFWDGAEGIPVMPPRAFERLVALARQ